eukprot:COSAG01_NODE_156_length_23748_cov_439.062371_11_plen_335_part_00
MCTEVLYRPLYHITGRLTTSSSSSNRTGEINDMNAIFECALLCPPARLYASPASQEFVLLILAAAHGRCRFGGLLHIMMQVDCRSWGHLVSHDLVHFKYLPDALAPSEWYDHGGVWDGSLNIVHGKPVIIYDCVGSKHPLPQQRSQRQGVPHRHQRNGDPPVIAAAFPANASDPELMRWVKDPNNPSFVSGPVRYESPGAVWHNKATGLFNMEMVLMNGPPSDHHAGTTALYTSTDSRFKNWTLADPKFFRQRGGGGGIFEPIPGAAGKTNYTHLLQVFVPPLPNCDGLAWFVLGKYSAADDSFTGVSDPMSLDAGLGFMCVHLHRVALRRGCL